MSSIKKITFCAICTALCSVLPPAFHMLALGSVFSPMHIPVLLCGLVCGWPYGAFCGVAGPIVASMITGMPPTAALVHMIPELCVYGLVCGVLMELVHTGRPYVDVYCALAPAMLLGRAAGGVARALFMLGGGQSYSLALWAGAYLVEAVPGIVLHLLLVPALVAALTRAGLIPPRSLGKRPDKEAAV